MTARDDVAGNLRRQRRLLQRQMRQRREALRMRGGDLVQTVIHIGGPGTCGVAAQLRPVERRRDRDPGVLDAMRVHPRQQRVRLEQRLDADHMAIDRHGASGRVPRHAGDRRQRLGENRREMGVHVEADAIRHVMLLCHAAADLEAAGFVGRAPLTIRR